jgi:hypothetical protein
MVNYAQCFTSRYMHPWKRFIRVRDSNAQEFILEDFSCKIVHFAKMGVNVWFHYREIIFQTKNYTFCCFMRIGQIWQTSILDLRKNNWWWDLLAVYNHVLCCLLFDIRILIIFILFFIYILCVYIIIFFLLE